MPPERRSIGRRQAVQSGLALGAALLEGCALEPRYEYSGSASSGQGGAGGSAGRAGSGSSAAGAGSGGSAGSIGTGSAAGSAGETIIDTTPSSGLVPIDIGNPPSGSACGAPGGAIFCAEVVWNRAPARRVVYSWTTDEQLEELRADPILFTRSERAGLGRGYAFTSIDELAARGDAPENQLLLRLSSELFTKVRYAWPRPWATRMGFPGEDYGDRLVEITLRPEAWTVVVRDGVGIAVIDLDNQVVPVTQALAELERIGAVYFVRTEIGLNGTFSTCSGGYREFILGNEAMVERWAIETPEIRTRLEADAALFDRFLELLRDGPVTLDPAAFPGAVACNWDLFAASELEIYERSLALASGLYLPRPAELAGIAAALREGLFEPDPLIVTPGG